MGLVVDSDCKVKAYFTSRESVEFEQKLMYYNSKIVAARMNAEGRPSGAYIFAPEGPAVEFPSMRCYIRTGPLYDEIRQEYEDWAGQIVRIYKDSKKYIEFDWTVGPIELL